MKKLQVSEEDVKIISDFMNMEFHKDPFGYYFETIDHRGMKGEARIEDWNMLVPIIEKIVYHPKIESKLIKESPEWMSYYTLESFSTYDKKLILEDILVILRSFVST